MCHTGRREGRYLSRSAGILRRPRRSSPRHRQTAFRTPGSVSLPQALPHRSADNSTRIQCRTPRMPLRSLRSPRRRLGSARRRRPGKSSDRPASSGCSAGMALLQRESSGNVGSARRPPLRRDRSSGRSASRLRRNSGRWCHADRRRRRIPCTGLARRPCNSRRRGGVEIGRWGSALTCSLSRDDFSTKASDYTSPQFGRPTVGFSRAAERSGGEPAARASGAGLDENSTPAPFKVRQPLGQRRQFVPS